MEVLNYEAPHVHRYMAGALGDQQMLREVLVRCLHVLF